MGKVGTEMEGAERTPAESDVRGRRGCFAEDRGSEGDGTAASDDSDVLVRLRPKLKPFVKSEESRFVDLLADTLLDVVSAEALREARTCACAGNFGEKDAWGQGADCGPWAIEVIEVKLDEVGDATNASTEPSEPKTLGVQGMDRLGETESAEERAGVGARLALLCRSASSDEDEIGDRETSARW